MKDRVTGPIAGYYIAARAVEIGDAWMGFACVYVRKPQSADDPNSLMKVSGDLGNAECALDAVENAERVAREAIADLPRRTSPN